MEEKDRERIQDKLLGLIFPNTPKTEEEISAFEKAVQYQYDYEQEKAAAMNGTPIPAGTTSFSIADFSMSFEKGYNGLPLTRKTLSPSAYGVLLHAGLLYKGVVGGGCCGVD